MCSLRLEIDPMELVNDLKSEECSERFEAELIALVSVLINESLSDMLEVNPSVSVSAR